MTTNGTQTQSRGQQYGNGQARTRQAPPPRMQDDITGSYSDPAAVADVLRRASEHYNLIGPMAFGALPEGFAVAMSVVTIDPATETYDVGLGRRGLGRMAVERIAAAAGVSTASSTCIGMAPNYAAWSVTVGRQDLDGSVRAAMKSRTMDLREGSGQIRAMREAALAKSRDPEGQIREQRLHIAAHAETKAWLRAVRTLLGLRTSRMPSRTRRRRGGATATRPRSTRCGRSCAAARRRRWAASTSPTPTTRAPRTRTASPKNRIVTDPCGPEPARSSADSRGRRARGAGGT
ncbi:MAG: hypothetical protein IT372_11465 [Polyangiaceae bacterium]|nr:hypothetical protein [Polyangiaceae bacterium]